MSKRIKVGLLLLFWLLFANPNCLWAEEDIASPVQTLPTQETQLISQITNFRHSFSKEKDRLVFDFNEPFTYQLISDQGSTDLIISVDGIDNRVNKNTTVLKDNALRGVEILPDPADSHRTLVKVGLNYKIKTSISVLTNPDRLVIDLGKIFEEETVREVTPGMTFKHIYAGISEGPLQIDLLSVDLHNNDLDIKPVQAKNGLGFSRETVSNLANQVGGLAAINGTYFASDGRPLGLLAVEGRLISYPWANRTAFGLTKDKKVLIDNVSLAKQIKISDGKIIYADGLNCTRGENELVLYTRERGLTTKTNQFGLEVSVVNNQVLALGCGDMPIPEGGYVISAHGEKRKLLENLKVGDPVQIAMLLTPNWLEEGVEHIVSGGPRLVKEGKVFLTDKEEKFRSDITQGRAPRSALGVTRDGKLLLVAVTGRQSSKSIGLTLNELANWMVRLGAVEAMNLDGGGSTTLLVEGSVVNSPSDGQERKVGNALVVTKKTQTANIKPADKPSWL